MHIEDQFETIDACRFCFMCRHVCTMGLATGWESDTPRGRALVLFKVLRGHAEYDEDLVQSIYRCCLCGVCQTWCKGDYTPPEAILAARRDIVEMGLEPEAARQIKQNVLTTGNPFGLPPADRFKNLELAAPSALSNNGQVLFYVGCHTAYHQPEIANALLHILQHCGIDVTLLDDETSTGKPLTVLGYHNEAKRMAEMLAARIKDSGCRLLVTACPSSFDALTNDYPAMGIDLGGIEVLHASQYLDRLIAQGQLVPSKLLDRAVTVLDSDRLGRFNNIYDEPRRLLQAIPGAELKEMSWTRDLAHSCGEIGGVLQHLYPELSLPLANRVLEEAIGTSAQVLATSCPVAKQSLTKTGNKDIEILDIVELVAKSID